MPYKWTVNDVFSILGIKVKSGKEVLVPCPFCGSKRFAMNTEIGAGHCWSCGEAADSASYYAKATGLSLYNARKDIEQRLNLDTNEPLNIPPRYVIKETKRPQAALAPIEIRNKTYNSFLNLLHLEDKNKYMLLARGFTPEQIDACGYKTFPSAEHVDFHSICNLLRRDGCVLEGVPGFYIEAFGSYKGQWSFVRSTKGIMIPYRNENNKIEGLQIRKDDDLRVVKDDGNLESKCGWFSSKNFNHGCAAEGFINYSCDYRYDEQTKNWLPVHDGTALLTEGGMKGDLTHYLLPGNMLVVSVPGVQNLKKLESTLKRLYELGVRDIIHCYDMDYLVKPDVAKAMEKTKTLILQSGIRYHFKAWQSKIVVQNKEYDLKGIDDYLAYIQKGILPKIKKQEEL